MQQCQSTVSVLDTDYICKYPISNKRSNLLPAVWKTFYPTNSVSFFPKIIDLRTLECSETTLEDTTRNLKYSNVEGTLCNTGLNQSQEDHKSIPELLKGNSGPGLSWLQCVMMGNVLTLLKDQRGTIQWCELRNPASDYLEK